MDENTVMNFEITGDDSSLKKAIKGALALVQSFEKTVKDSVGFNFKTTGLAQFDAAVSSVIKKANTFADIMAKSSSAAKEAMQADVTTINKGFAEVNAAVELLSENINASDKDVKILTDDVKAIGSVFSAITDRARVMSSHLKGVETAAIALKKMKAVNMSVDTSDATKYIQNTTDKVNELTEKIRDVKPYSFDTVSNAAKSMSTSVTEAGEKMKMSFVSGQMAAQAMQSRMNALPQPIQKVVNMLSQLRQTAKQAFSQEQISALDRVKSAVNNMAPSLLASQLGFRSVAQSADAASNSFDKVSNSLKEIATSSNSANNSLNSTKDNLNGASTSAKQAEKEFIKTGEAAAKMATAKAKTEKLKNAFSQLGDAFKRAGNSLAGLNRRTKATQSLFSKLVKFASLYAIGRALKSAIKESISYIENLNLFTVAMGESVDEAKKFVNQMSEIYNLDPSNLMRYTGYFYQLTDAIGMSAKASKNLSLSMTKAAIDVSSLFNEDIETVVENLSSGMMGMSRSVKKYGMDIRVATLQQTALSYGLTESVSNMSEANRQALRYLTMIDQVNNALKQNYKQLSELDARDIQIYAKTFGVTFAEVEDAVQQAMDGSTEALEKFGLEVRNGSIIIGDFANNIETPANQLRIFKEQITQLGRAIGNFFLPVLDKVLYRINGIVMAIRTMLQYLARLMGIDIENMASGAQGVESNVEGIGDAAEDAAKKMKQLTAPFDELNIISEDTDEGDLSDFGTLDPALEKAIEDATLSLDAFRTRASEVAEDILSFFGFVELPIEFDIDGNPIATQLDWIKELFHDNLVSMFPEWQKTIDSLFENWPGIVDGLKATLESLGGVFDTLIEKVKSFIGQFINDESASSWIAELPNQLQGLASWIDEHSGQIADFIILIGEIVLAFKAFSVISEVIGFVTKFTSVISPLMGVLKALVGVLTSLSLPMLALISFLVALTVATIDLYNADEDFRNACSEGWEKLCSIFEGLWEGVLKPVLDNLAEKWDWLWTQWIEPVLQDISRMLLELWNGILYPLIDWLGSYLGPNIKSVCNLIVNFFAAMVANVVKVLGGIVDFFYGLVEIISGIISGDLTKVFKGLQRMIEGVINAIIGVFEGFVNILIGAINTALNVIGRAIIDLANTLIKAINTISQAFGGGKVLDELSYDIIPQVKYMTMDRVSFDDDSQQEQHAKGQGSASLARYDAAFATGGVVTGPTRALIGEGQYDEAVIPLGNSPQLEAMIDQFAHKVNSNGNSNQPVEVRVYIGDREWDAFTYQSAERGKKLVGPRPVEVT